MATKVKMNKDVWKKIEIITKEYPLEFGGLLFGEIKAGEVNVTDILFPKQKVTGASVDMENEDLLECRKDNKVLWDKFIGYWHSHNTMSAFFSTGNGTSGGDESEHIRLLSSRLDVAFFIVTAFNKNRVEYCMRLTLSKPIKLEVNDLELDIGGDDEYDKLKKETLDMVESKVKKVETSYVGSEWNKDSELFNDVYFVPQAKGVVIDSEGFEIYAKLEENSIKYEYSKEGIFCPVKDKKEADELIKTIKSFKQQKTLKMVDDDDWNRQPRYWGRGAYNGF